jgi:2-oxoglutarate dehydrogenase E1 component
MSNNFDKNSFLFAANGDFVEDLYIKYIESPNNVDEYWRDFFSNLGDNELQALKSTEGASWLPRKNKVILPPEVKPASKEKKVEESTCGSINNINFLISDYRNYGHLLSKLDPLGLEKPYQGIKLDINKYGISEEDLNTEITLNNEILSLGTCTIRQVINKLKDLYCSSVGYELSHLFSDEEKEWFYNQIEQVNASQALSNEDKINALKDLIDVEGFEQFIHTRFPGTKRFSVEGGEASISAVKQIIKTATSKSKVEEVIIGMPHRGRLNMLTKVMGKDYASMLSEFQGNLSHMESLNISGDVKYHLGKSTSYIAEDGHKVHLSLTANPSHLEAVNPVVAGKVRAKQDCREDHLREKVMGLTMHGDAAFIGQGVVVETLCLSDLESYTTGGTMHIVVNNQIGFTTLPKDGRRGRYPTEFAKVIGAPIIHVNGDDIEKVLLVAELAENYRHKFKKDIVIDVVCFRKYGHNEGDEPMFTQPVMYDVIKHKKSCVELYAEKLDKAGIISKEESSKYRAEKMKFFDAKLEEAKTFKPSEEDWLKDKWVGFDKCNRVKEKSPSTGVSIEKLEEVGQALINYPKDFYINSKVQRLLDNKKKMMETGKAIDWATAEALAYGTLMAEGSRVRMTGQDCKRGTFSHRHAVLFDQKSEQEYVSLNHIDKSQAKLEVVNSSLSEYAVLGFEYGYSMVNPKDLTIWEAQFGDFSNGAQIMIDQFIASSEVKWLRMSGLMMLLPHGYEGQGPEHSSARLERYLQLCAEQNMQVVNCTTPANFFHVIRRQIHRKFRKPLIIMSPKSLLRHKMVISDLSEMTEGTSFKPIIGEIDTLDNNVKRVVLCSGRVFVDLYEKREKEGIKDVALIRVEQCYPFPKEELATELKKYKNAEIIWCQEEPKNMGAWHFIQNKIENCLISIGRNNTRPIYAGRPAAASPSAGYFKMHVVEQEKLVKQAITGV